MGAALSGIRVVDLSRLLPGPLASLMLSDLGAEVTSVDSAHNPDYMRAVPPICDDGVSLFFHALHRGKYRVSLDLRTEEGKAELHALLLNADVLIESYRPGVLAALGFADDFLKENFPKLIVCHLSGYGQTGEMANRAGHDLNFLAESGVLGLIDKPGVLPIPLADVAAGSFGAVMQMMAALLQRQNTGLGTVIDHNIASFCAALAMPQWVSPTGAGFDSAYILSGFQPCYTVYETLDGHLAIGALEFKFWKIFVEHLGASELIDLAITDHEKADEVRKKIQRILRQKSTANWESEFNALNICVSPVRDFNDPKAVALRPKGVTLESVTIDGEPVELPRLPFVRGLNL